MPTDDWLKEYQTLLKSSLSTLSWADEFVRQTDLTGIEKEATRSLQLYIRSALHEASGEGLSKQEMDRRRKKIDRAYWKLLLGYKTRILGD